MTVNLSLYIVLPCSCVTGMVFTICESPLHGKDALQSQGTLPGLEYTFLNGFFPKVGFFRNKAVTVSTKAPLHQ